MNREQVQGESISNVFGGSKNFSSNPNENNSGNYAGDEATWGEYSFVLGIELVKYAFLFGVSYYTVNKFASVFVEILKPEKSNASFVEKQKLADRLHRPEIATMIFDSYENRLLPDVIGSKEIQVTFQNVGGLDHQVEEVIDNVVLPIRYWHSTRTYDPSFCPCPTGVLLYGSPGTGKTLIAKAIAREANAIFLNIKASSILDKWLGESDKLVAAIFSLARKLAPTVIFLDEVESILRKRDGSNSNTILSTIQGVFLAEWDGLVSALNKNEKIENETAAVPTANRLPPIVVLGATNRPNDIDPAFLRRMPVQIRTFMPDKVARLSILNALLLDEAQQLAEDVNLDIIAEKTIGFSGSDLKELVRNANLFRSKEITFNMKKALNIHTTVVSETNNTPVISGAEVKMEKRSICQEDFMQAIQKMSTIRMNAHNFAYGVQQMDADIRAKANDVFSNLFDQLRGETKLA